MEQFFTSIFGTSTGTTTAGLSAVTNIDPMQQTPLPTMNTSVNPYSSATLLYPTASEIIAAMARGASVAKKQEPAVSVLPDPVKPSPKQVEVNVADAEFAKLNEAIAQEAAEKLGYQPLANELTRIRCEQRLVEAIQAVGIVPLDREQVSAYKKAMSAKKYEEEARRRQQSYVYDMIRVTWVPTLLSAYTEPIPQHVLQTALTLREELSRQGDVTATFHVDALRIDRVTHDPFLFVTAGFEGSPRHYIAVWDEPEFERVKK